MWEVLILIFGLAKAIFDKTILTPAQRARKSWNNWRRDSDENAKKRADRVRDRINTAVDELRETDKGSNSES